MRQKSRNNSNYTNCDMNIQYITQIHRFLHHLCFTSHLYPVIQEYSTFLFWLLIKFSMAKLLKYQKNFRIVCPLCANEVFLFLCHHSVTSIHWDHLQLDELSEQNGYALKGWNGLSVLIKSSCPNRRSLMSRDVVHE